MPKPFELEDRFFFIKYKDMDNFTTEEYYRAVTALQTLNTLFPARKGIVIEDDYPIYPQVLELLKQSVEAS